MISLETIKAQERVINLYIKFGLSKMKIGNASRNRSWNILHFCIMVGLFVVFLTLSK